MDLGQRVAISIGPVQVEAQLNDTPCAAGLAQALPLEAQASVWGDEIYFATPIDCELADDARDRLAVGDLAYWPPGKALCLFFGPTPASGADGVPVSASAVNVVGRLRGSPEALRSVKPGQRVSLRLVEPGPS